MKTITDKFETILISAGCGATIYENPQLVGITTDTIEQDIITGIIVEPATGRIVISGGGAIIQFAPWIVEVVKQVRPEDTAAHNEDTLDALLKIARKFVVLLGHDGGCGKIGDVPFSRIIESRYDANVIGWGMTISVTPLEYQSNC